MPRLSQTGVGYYWNRKCHTYIWTSCFSFTKQIIRIAFIFKTKFAIIFFLCVALFSVCAFGPEGITIRCHNNCSWNKSEKKFWCDQLGSVAHAMALTAWGHMLLPTYQVLKLMVTTYLLKKRLKTKRWLWHFPPIVQFISLYYVRCYKTKFGLTDTMNFQKSFT